MGSFRGYAKTAPVTEEDSGLFNQIADVVGVAIQDIETIKDLGNLVADFMEELSSEMGMPKNLSVDLVT